MRRLAALAALVALLLPAAARADGDPASDYLYTQWVFLPFDTKIPAARAAQLRALVAETRRAGYPIKVAMIGSRSDLGAASALWQQPAQYARFLGAELVFLYRGRLLIVMPNGLGLSRAGRPDPQEEAAIRTVRVGAGGSGLVDAAIASVRRLAARAGHPTSLPTATAAPAKTSSNRDRAIVGAAVLAAALFWAAVLLRRRRAATGS